MRRIIFILFLILSPGFWWMIVHPPKFGEIPLNMYSNFVGKKISIFSSESLLRIGKLRWSNVDIAKSTRFTSKLFYNKGTLVFNELGSFASFFSPRFYFQAGDGVYTSGAVEPMPILLFPFWIYGLFTFIKNGKYAPIIFIIIWTLLTFLFGRHEMLYLWPVLVAYVYIATEGLWEWKPLRFKGLFLILILVYSLYITGRALWIEF